MKFCCEKYLLNSAVVVAGRAAPSKSPVPALEGLLIRTDAASSQVIVTGFDMRKAIYVKIPADVAQEGAIIINARLLADITRMLPDADVTITSDASNLVKITCGNADYNITGFSPEDYPELPTVDYTNSVTLDQAKFSRMIAQTSFAIATSESRPIYTGALMDIKEGMLTMVAVDGFRMAIRKEAVMDSDLQELHIIVPGYALADLEKICQSPEEPVILTVSKKYASFTVGDTVVLTRLLEGDFLNYEKTIPQNSPVQVTAARTSLIRSVERVAQVISDKTKNPLRCYFEDGSVKISCSTPIGSAEDVCAVDGTGDGLMIGFNHSYLLDALKNAPADTIRIHLGGSNTPCIITADDESSDFLYMILPVRLRSE